MVILDLQEINKTSPYIISIFDSKGSYVFTTDNGYEYVITFMIDYNLQSDKVYQFIITNSKQPHSSKDYKVRDAIIAIVKNFFTLNNNTILYFCDTSDNRQYQRDRLFKRWIEAAGGEDGMITISSSIKDIDGTENYITLLSRSDNPNLEAVVSEFKKLMQDLKNKPN